MRQKQLNLTLQYIKKNIYTPMNNEGRIEIPLEYFNNGHSKLYMRLVRRLGEVTRYFKVGYRSGYRVRYYNNKSTNQTLPFETLFTLMTLYKTNIIDKDYKVEKSRKTFSDLFLNLLEEGYNINIIEDMVEIEKQLINIQ
jgi:hypothetical protein